MMSFKRIYINLQGNTEMKLEEILILEINLMNYVIKWMLTQ
jgi:hypothetical protein